MTAHVLVERVVIGFVSILFTCFYRVNDTEALVPSAEVQRCVQDVVRKFLELSRHFFERWVVLELVANVLALLLDHRIFAVPDDLVGGQCADCHRDQSVEDLALPVLVIGGHGAVALRVGLERRLLDLL